MKIEEVFVAYNHLGHKQPYVVAGAIIERLESKKIGNFYLQKVVFRCRDGSIVHEYIKF